jgi:hypothetical protein
MKGTFVDLQRLTTITPSSTRVPSRRDVLCSLLGAGIGFGAMHLLDDVAAERKHRKKRNKNKQHKQHDQAQVPTTVTHTARQTVTKIFTNSRRITIPDDSDAPRPTAGKALPYPSAIHVSGFTNGVITDVNLTLNGFTHTASADVDVLISKDNGRQALVMSDVGDAGAIGVDLNLDDEAASALSRRETLQSGTFQPTDFVSVVGDGFDAPAPTPNGAFALSTFDGADPNGTWQLWIMDNSGQDVGEFAGGWSLEITAEVDVEMQDQVPQSAAAKRRHQRSILQPPIGVNAVEDDRNGSLEAVRSDIVPPQTITVA